MNSQLNLFENEQDAKPSIVYRGGFPCQPHSVAGKRKASSDERDLWPEMRSVISEIKPRWVVAENVRGLLSSEDGRFFRGILRDFADMGFNVGWCTYRAADVGAIHARERVAVIAYDGSIRGKCSGKKQIRGKLDVSGIEDGRGVEIWNKRCNIFEPKLLRNSHGVPRQMDRLHALGNAVVPQQFYPIFKAIAELEEVNYE